LINIILSGIVIVYLSAAYPQQLNVIPGKLNSIKFLANSTISNFEGNTSAAEGFINWDSTQINNSKIEFKVYLDSLDTGIGLRNTHMREKYLETDKFPAAEFKGRIISLNKKTSIESEVAAEGNLKIHGVDRRIKITGRLYNDYGQFRLESSFDIFLSDYNIDKPSFLFISVENKITIECSIYLTGKS